jgi:hypothetical protein
MHNDALIDVETVNNCTSDPQIPSDASGHLRESVNVTYLFSSLEQGLRHRELYVNKFTKDAPVLQ